MKERESDLLALILGAQQQTGGKVFHVVAGGFDVGVKILVKSGSTVLSHVVGVCYDQGGQTGLCSGGGDESLIQVGIGTDVLGVDGDEILGGVEPVHYLSYQVGVLILKSVPPGDSDGLGNFVEARILNNGLFFRGGLSCSGTGGAGGTAASAEGEHHAEGKSQG